MDTYTCPRCGRTSWNQNDVAHRYCGACHAFEADDLGAAQRFAAYLESQGYRCLRQLPTGEWAGLHAYLFAVGLVVGLGLDG